MRDVRILPISQAAPELVGALMRDEERAWRSELNWDYSPIREILVSFLEHNLLPGLVAVDGSKAIGYTYHLIHKHKGIIGTFYALKESCSQEVVNELLAGAIESLTDSGEVRRIEAQIMPFNDIGVIEEFTRHGFSHYSRYFLELPLSGYINPARDTADRIISWDSQLLPLAAEVAFRSYQNEADARICEDYCSAPGCESYLRSLVENPGCGTFLPDASYIALDEHGRPCGFIVASRISRGAGMIPQIAIHPSHQGRGVGTGLMRRALGSFQSLGYRSVGLTVTLKNRRAFEWYRRIGFQPRKEFGAYVWERQ
jgi:ribosomal protein S18 acetylase RimI-like enzyme